MSSKTKFEFTITDINTDEIHTKFNMFNTEKKSKQQAKVPTKITKITDLKEKNITFLDSSKELKSCNVSVIDFNSNQEVNMLKYHCFWCRNPFTTMPIGCPVSHKPTIVNHEYLSEINQLDYTIEENSLKSKTKTLHNKDIYFTDGIFCSFNCCRAYIEDNKHINNKYENSMMLLLKMYKELTGMEPTNITKAPHWRTIKQYGGFLTINDFRKSFNTVEYEEKCDLKQPIFEFRSNGLLYEKKLKF